jgi:hypothetical protein
MRNEETLSPSPIGVNPHVYFNDLITRLVNGWPQQKRIDALRKVADHRLLLTEFR